MAAKFFHPAKGYDFLGETVAKAIEAALKQSPMKSALSLNIMKPTLTLLTALLLALLATLHAADATKPAAKPNIILFLIDDLGWRDLGCQGSTYYQTPNIDRLAKEGVRFTDAYSACAVCSPTRAAILTGKYSARLRTE